tara:strand:+ start:902 stop:1087 length:186 start_codon:yes stop_codon:yes gene_type:complete
MARKTSTLKSRLKKELESVGKNALRDPRTWKEVAIRARWDRIRKIIWRRYERKDDLSPLQR